MSYYNQGYEPSPAPQNAQNLQFFPSSYSGVSGHTTPSQAAYGGYGGGANTASAYPQYGSGMPANFGAQGVTGRMGEQGGLRTGWIAAFSTEGYEGEPGLMEELGVNFGHIRDKVRTAINGERLSAYFAQMGPRIPFLSRSHADHRLYRREPY